MRLWGRRNWVRVLFFAVGFACTATEQITSAQTIINIPPMPSPASAGADTIVNLLPSGTLTSTFQALDGSILNIQGGRAFRVIGENGSHVNMTSGEASNLMAKQGSLLEVHGGRIYENIQAESEVVIRGGRIDLLFDVSSTSGNITVSGGAIERIDIRNSVIAINGIGFAIDGVPVTGLNSIGDTLALAVPVGSVLTGMLADGRAFGHHHPVGFTEPFQVTLIQAAVPPLPTPSEIHVNGESDLEWIGEGQTAYVEAGGFVVEHFRAGPNSRLEVNGGYVREALHAVAAEVELNGGTIARRSKFFDDSVVTVNGGQLQDGAFFYTGSMINVFGGQVDGARIYQGAVGNVHDGEVYGIRAADGGVVNVYGGRVNYLSADDGSTLNIYGGTIVDKVDTTGAEVNVYGGAFTDLFDLRTSSQLTLHATEIRLNGELVSGLVNSGDMTTIGVGSGAILSGVFENGTPFVLGGEEYDLPSSVKVVQAAAYTPGPATIHVPTDAAPQGIHNGQTLILTDGGALPMNFTAGHGSAVMVQGGTVDNNFEAVGAMVDVTGGQLGTIDAFVGSVVNISGSARWSQLDIFDGATATINSPVTDGGGFQAYAGSTVHIENIQLNGAFRADGAVVSIAGGSIAHYQQASIVTAASQLSVTGGHLGNLSVFDGSTAHVSGGVVDYLQISSNVQAEITGGQVKRLAVDHGSTAEVRSGILGDTDNFNGTTRIRGGALGDSHEWLDGRVELHGYDFQINGVPISGLDVVGNSKALNYVVGSTITGTLSDGTPFNLAPNDNFQSLSISNGVLRLVRSDTPTLATTINIPTDPAPYGASAGQTIVLNEGGALGENFLAGHDSTVEIHGGMVGDNFEAERSQVTISGGAIGDRMDVFQGAEVTITGGSIGEEIEIHAGGVLHLQGGQIAGQGKAVGGTLIMSGGSLGGSFTALQGATANISGGFVGSGFGAEGGSTVNVSGGKFDRNFRADSGSQVHISGGHLGNVRAMMGSNVNISGGKVDDVDVLSGSNVFITGGSFGDDFTINSSANATLTGLDFEIDGVPIAGLDAPGNQVEFFLATNQLFTGTLADGTPFAFRSNEGDAIAAVKLIRAADLPVGPNLIEVPTDAAPNGVRTGQQLVLLDGGSLPDNFNAGRGSVVDIMGGVAGQNFEAFSAVINIHAGQVGSNFDAFAGSQINVLGGSVGTNFDAYAGSEVNVEGGAVARLDALNGSAINLAGGQIASLQAANGSHAVWTGGTIGTLNVSGASSMIAMHGVGFQLNGVPITGLENEGDSLQFNLPTSSVLTATLADGTPVLLYSGLNSPAANAQVADGALTLVRSAEPGLLGPLFQVVSDGKAPFAVGAGQTLLVVPGGTLPSNFVAGPGSKLLIQGGSTGSALKAFGGEIRVTAGNVGSNFIGLQGLELIIEGGVVDGGFSLFSGAHAIISGGMLPTPLLIDAGAEVDIYGTSFLLNNQPIAGLENLGDSLVLEERGGQILKAILADGTLLEWRLNASFSPRTPFGFSEQAILRLHVVPEPTVAVLLIPILFVCCLAATGSRCRRSIGDTYFVGE